MIINIDGVILSDNSKEVRKNPNAIFVKTALNKRFWGEVESNNIDLKLDSNLSQNSNAKLAESNIKSIFPRDLHKYLLHLPKIIGITGTNGKTTTAHAIYFILLKLGFKCALLGTQGFFINGKNIAPKGLTTPMLLEIYYDIHLASKQQCDFFIMEVSSHAIAQERIEALNFHLKILSNITGDHLDFHKNLEEYIRIKNSFFADGAMKLINRDEPKAHFNVENAYSYGIEHSANMRVLAYGLRGGLNGLLEWRDVKKNINECAEFSVNLAGKFNLYNAICAICAAKLISDISLEHICAAFEEFEGVEGRAQIMHKNPLVIVDFAHTPDGMKNIFEAFLGHKIKVVFGAGGNRDRLKRPKMGAIAEIYALKIYLTSDNPRDENENEIIDEILGGIKNRQKVIIEPNRARAINLALSELKNDEMLLILGKGDEVTQEIKGEFFAFDDRLKVKEFYKNI